MIKNSNTLASKLLIQSPPRRSDRNLPRWSLILTICLALIAPLIFVYASLLAAGYSPSFSSEANGFISLGAQADQPNIFRQVKRILTNAGAMGDYFGGLLNPIIAICALIGLAISVDVQRRTLHETRKGLREQLDQENFFQLLENRESAIQNLELHQRGSGFALSILNKLGFDSPRKSAVYTGRTAIREILNYIDSRIKAADSFEDKHVQEILAEYCIDAEILSNIPAASNRVCFFIVLYTGLHNLNKKKLSIETVTWANTMLKNFQNQYAINNIEELMGHVFRATYQVLKFVYRSDFDDEKKLNLVNYLRAQMSEAEFAAFALTGLTSIGDKSRAVSISFDFYQRRLLSTDWAHDILFLFTPKSQENIEFANKFDYKPVPLVLNADKNKNL